MLEHFIVAEVGVQEECSAFLDALQEIVASDIAECGAGDEVRRGDEVGALDRFHAETQVRNGDAEGFLGVVGEVRLGIHVIAVLADDLDGVLVCADCSVAAETPEHAVRGAFRLGDDLFVNLEGGVGDVIVDTDGEAVEAVFREVLVDSENHGGGELLGGETVTAADDADVHAGEGDDHIEVERLADCARLFGAVENRDAFDRGGKRFLEGFDIERTVEADFDETELHAAFGIEVLNRFVDGFAAGTHGDDDVGCISRADIVEEVILTAGLGCDLVHVFLNDRRGGVVEFVDRFTTLEVDVRVLGADVGDRLVRAETACAELFNVLGFDKFLDFVVGDFVVLVNFVGGTESVEELQERNASLVGGEVGDEREIHFFLDGSGGEHGETGVAAGHDVGVVAEDGERLSCEGTGGDMEDGRDELAGDLVHVRDHQEQTLGSGVGAGESARNQRTVNGSGRACFRLHLCNFDLLAPNVLLAFCRPLVNPLAHGGRRGDRIDGCDFAQRVSDVCGTIVTVLCVCNARHSIFLLTGL